MTIRSVYLAVYLVLTFLAAGGFVAGCSKSDEHRAAETPAPVPAPDALDLKVSAVQARARLMETKFRDQTTRLLLREEKTMQQQAIRSARTADGARTLDAGDAIVRKRALESEHTAIEAERAGYNALDNVIEAEQPRPAAAPPAPAAKRALP